MRQKSYRVNRPLRSWSTSISKSVSANKRKTFGVDKCVKSLMVVAFAIFLSRSLSKERLNNHCIWRASIATKKTAAILNSKRFCPGHSQMSCSKGSKLHDSSSFFRLCHVRSSCMFWYSCRWGRSVYFKSSSSHYRRIPGNQIKQWSTAILSFSLRIRKVIKIRFPSNRMKRLLGSGFSLEGLPGDLVT